MMSILVTLFFGWPAVLASVIVSGIGLFKNKYILVVLGAILAFPFSWFVSGFPIVHSPVFLAPLLLFSAAFALSRRHEMIAWVLGILFYLFVFLLYFAALSQG